MWPHLLAVSPKLIIAFGRDAAEFFCCGYCENRILGLPNDAKARVISLPFPKRSWSAAYRSVMSDWVKRSFSLGVNGPLPPRDFADLQRTGAIKAYVLNPLTPEVLQRLDCLAPQARACIAIMWLGSRTEYTPAELKTLIEQHSTDPWTYRADKPLRTRQDPWHIFDYYRRKLVAIGAISEKS